MVTTAHAWWGTAHMLVARIAEQTLESRNPEVLRTVQEILSQDTFA